MQLKYSNYAAFSHVHGVAVNNSGELIKILQNLNSEQLKLIKQIAEQFCKKK